MLEPLSTPAQTQIGVNLYVPSQNAVYHITDVQGWSDDPEITVKRCNYDGTLAEPQFTFLFSSLQSCNFLVVVDTSH